MFRMPLDCFHLLCEKILDGVGEEVFLSEEYIKRELQRHKNKKGNMFRANMTTTGGYLSGEIRVAIALRLLGGGSFLDISTIFDVSYSTTYEVFHYVTEKWFCKDWVAEYSLEKNLSDPDALYETSKKFSAKGRSNGILGGIIGAIDGWLVKIKSPSYKRDGVRNSGTYFSRKGFFALNIQVIVDRDKRVLWRTINSKGSEHDSSAFKETQLYSKLVNCYDKLKLNGLQLYLIGDSAYALRPFLLCPYDKASPESAEDIFNFMLSSNRIFVECAFGEIDARFGIFWRPLQFELKRHRFIIDSCLRLHNFILDYRLRTSATDTAKEDWLEYSSECLSFLINNPDVCVGVYGNGSIGSSSNSVGRPSINEKNLRDAGLLLRDHLRDRLVSQGLQRERTWDTDVCHHTTTNDD